MIPNGPHYKYMESFISVDQLKRQKRFKHKWYNIVKYDGNKYI